MMTIDLKQLKEKSKFNKHVITMFWITKFIKNEAGKQIH